MTEVILRQAQDRHVVIKLLIADDEDLQRQALRRTIEACQLPSVQVIGEAGDGRSAADLAAALGADIVLMDIEMPEANGLQAIAEIRRRSPTTKIIVITAYDYFEYAQQTLKLGVVDFLLKPVRPETVESALAHACRQVELERRQAGQEQELREQLVQAMPSIKMAWVQDLLNGARASRAELTERARFLGQADLPALALVLDIDCFRTITSTASEGEKQILKARVCDAVADCLQSIPSALVVPWGGDEILVLLPPGQARAEEVKPWALRMAERMRAAVKQNTAVTVSAGVGRVYPDAPDIRKSYQEAVTALRSAIFDGKDQTVHIDDVQISEVNTRLYPFEKEHALLSLIQLGDQASAQTILPEIMREIQEATPNSLSATKVRLFELLTLASRSAAEGGADGDQVLAINLRCLSQLSAATTFGELGEIALRATDEFVRKVSERKEAHKWHLMQQALAYIATHYREGVTQEEVAQVIHLSAGYFSRFFRQEQGMTFSEYLASLRMDKARHLLRTSPLSIAEISAQVGYGDPNYFSRAFSKTYGMSPTEFREASKS